jgi:hypothetical protein
VTRSVPGLRMGQGEAARRVCTIGTRYSSYFTDDDVFIKGGWVYSLRDANSKKILGGTHGGKEHDADRVLMYVLRLAQAKGFTHFYKGDYS